MDISTIEKIASDVRLKFENGTVDRNKVIDLYLREYGKRGDVDKVNILNSLINNFPHFNCELATLYLEDLILGSQAVDGRYRSRIGTERHTFLVVGDIIVDITADQFGGPKVYVGELKSPWSVDAKQL